MPETIPQLFVHLTDSFKKPALLLYKKDGRYTPISTDEVRQTVTRIALGLRDQGVRHGDKVILLAENGPWWVMTDYAIICLGAVTVPVYTSLVPEQIKYIINDSDAKVVVVSDRRLWEKIALIKGDLLQVNTFISLEAAPPAPDVLPLSRVEERGAKVALENPSIFLQIANAVRPEDIASIIYTSGTTGVPKGVMLTHGNFVSNVETLASIIEFGPSDIDLSFLPLSHVLERLGTFAFLSRGTTMAYAESIETVAENLVELRPSIMISVPRLFEKIYSRVMETVLTGSFIKKKIFTWAVSVGRACGARRLLNQPLTRPQERKLRLSHKLVFSKILEKTGGRVRFFVSGGAPLAKDIAEFFYAMGLFVLEGYGLTETSPVIAVNTFANLRFGTVGKPIPCVEVKIASDGEILVKGPNVMKGYYKKPAETQEALVDGWLHTGDIGYLDRDGFLVITDRKKDLIVTSGGKNIAPQPIENQLKQNPYILNAVVLGSRRKFVSALIVPNFEKLEEYAKGQNIPYVNRRDLIHNETLLRFLGAEVDRATPNLAPYEKIKKIAVLERDFEIEKGEITPTLKVKRNIVEEKFKDVIDTLYRE
jgi:long-chain acyl-CoA synthetase